MNKSVSKAIHYAVVLTALGVVCAGGVAGLYAAFKPKIDEQKRLAEEAAFKQVLPTNIVTFSDSGLAEEATAKELQPRRSLAVDSATGLPFKPERKKEKLRAVYVVTGKTDEQVVGFAAKGRGRGYGGVIDVVVGVRADRYMTIYNVTVTNQNETPGLGANCQLKRTNKNIYQKLFGDTAGERISVWTDQFGSAPFVPAKPTETKGKNLRALGENGKPAADVKVVKDGGKIDSISGATITSRAVSKAVSDAIKKIAAVTRWDESTKQRVLKQAASAPAPSTQPAETP